MNAIINGVNYEIPDALRMSTSARLEVITPYVSNGCGTNRFNKFFIRILEGWLGTELRIACFLHDLEYDIIKRDEETGDYQFIQKMEADAYLHINIYTLCMMRAVSQRKALRVARLFHAAVLLFGHRSAGLNEHILARSNNSGK